MLANRSKQVSGCGVLLVGALFFMTTPAFAQRAALSGPSEANRETAAGPAGKVAAVKPSAQQATTGAQGKFSEPTREEIQVLLEGVQELVSQSHEGLTVVEHPDGSLSLDHQGRFQNVMVAKTNPDGSVSMECASTVEQVRQFLADKKQMGPVKPVSVKPVSSSPKNTALQSSMAKAIAQGTAKAKREEK